MDLNPRQFVAYRGLLVDTGRAPEDNEEILSRINPKGPDRTLYGRHWSTDPEVARRFATKPNAGGYETLPSRMRKFSGGGDKWGVVLEAQAHGRASDSSVPYSEHEKEVPIHRPDVDHPAANHAQSIVAHVYDQPSLSTLQERYPRTPGDAGYIRRRREAFHASYSEPVRSFEIPKDHWA